MPRNDVHARLKLIVMKLKSCSTREINLVFPSIHVFFCLLYKGSLQGRRNIDNWGGRYSYIRVLPN